MSTTAAITAPALYAITTGTIFGARNAKKVEEGEVGRLPVTIAQGAKVINSIFDQVNVFDKMAQNESALISGSAKVVNFARNNINNLIGVSSGIKFLMAKNEDKKDVLFEEGASFGGMLAVEGWMNENLDTIGHKLVNKFSKGEIKLDALKHNKYYSIIKGLVFVTGSILGSSLAAKIGKMLAQKVPNPCEKKD